MTDDYTIFKLVKVPNFFKDMNRQGCFELIDEEKVYVNGSFDTEEMVSTNKQYRLMFASNCSDVITENIYSKDESPSKYGQLKDNVKLHDIDEEENSIALYCNQDLYGNITISVAEPTSLTITFDDTSSLLKGIFLIDSITGYCMAYSILAHPVSVSSTTIFPLDGVLWTLKQEIEG